MFPMTSQRLRLGPQQRERFVRKLLPIESIRISFQGHFIYLFMLHTLFGDKFLAIWRWRSLMRTKTPRSLSRPTFALVSAAPLAAQELPFRPPPV